MTARAHGRGLRVAVVLLFAAGVLVVVIALGGNESSSTKSGRAVISQTRTVPAFQGIDLVGANTIVVDVGGKRAVVVRGERDAVAKVTTTVVDGVLRVGQTGDLNARNMWVDVSAPSLASVRLSGAGTIVAGGGEVRRLAATIAARGSGTLELNSLRARDVRATLDGTGTILVTATRSLDAELSGTGSIAYSGSPAQVTKSVTGTGSVAGG